MLVAYRAAYQSRAIERNEIVFAIEEAESATQIVGRFLSEEARRAIDELPHGPRERATVYYRQGSISSWRPAQEARAF